MTAGRVQTEDVLTEVVAHLFRIDATARDDLDTALIVSWLRAIGGYAGLGVQRVSIATQQTYARLPARDARGAHTRDSRPDLVIDLTDAQGSSRRVVIESKVGSGEGTDQLRYYAEHLHEQGGGTLVYLTRDYDPKQSDPILRHAGDVGFRQARWYGVARHIRRAQATAALSTHSLYDDTLAFLTSLRMTTPPQFTPTDAVALGRIGQTTRFLDSTLWEGDQQSPKPVDHLRDLVGGFSKYGAVPLWRIHENKRYVLRRQLSGGEHDSFEIVLGYQFGEDAMPQLLLGVGSKQPAHAGGIRSIASSDTSWAPGHANSGWHGAYLYRDMAALLVGHDHAANIREAFHEMLESLREVIDLTRDTLPWDVLGGSGTDGDDVDG